MGQELAGDKFTGIRGNDGYVIVKAEIVKNCTEAFKSTLWDDELEIAFSCEKYVNTDLKDASASNQYTPLRRGYLVHPWYVNTFWKHKAIMRYFFKKDYVFVRKPQTAFQSLKRSQHMCRWVGM
jgi:hypothetical protein